MCAHDFGSRSIVVSENRVVNVSLTHNARRNAFLSVDGGKATKINMGDVITIRKSNLSTKLIRLKARSFFDVVNMKFKNSWWAMSLAAVICISLLIFIASNISLLYS